MPDVNAFFQPMNCQALPNLSNYLQDNKAHRMKEKLHCAFLRDTHVCAPFIDANLKNSCFILLKSSVPLDPRPAQVSPKYN